VTVTLKVPQPSGTLTKKLSEEAVALEGATTEGEEQENERFKEAFLIGEPEEPSLKYKVLVPAEEEIEDKLITFDFNSGSTIKEINSFLNPVLFISTNTSSSKGRNTSITLPETSVVYSTKELSPHSKDKIAPDTGLLSESTTEKVTGTLLPKRNKFKLKDNNKKIIKTKISKNKTKDGIILSILSIKP